MKKTPLLLACLSLILLNGCATATSTITPAQRAITPSQEATFCTTPRPEICTMHYAPVCGEKENGERQTYSNGCSACSDKNVVNYIEGECPPQ